MNDTYVAPAVQAPTLMLLDWLLSLVFPTALPPGVHPVVCSFPGNPKTATGAWSPRPWAAGTSIDVTHNCYFTLATYRADETDAYRPRWESAVALYGVMLDDVGSKARPLSDLDRFPPSVVTETSAGNHQAIYLFDGPLTDKVRAQALQDALIAAGYCDKGASSPMTRWSRLPVGVNSKHSPPQPVELRGLNCERRYSVEQIVAGLGLTLDPPKPARPPGAADAEWSALPEAKRTEIVEDLGAALKHLDADDRDKWVAVGEALKALGDEGHALWAEWSATSLKWDDRASDQWHTFKGERSSYRSVFSRAMAEGWKNPRRGPSPTEVGFTGSGGIPPTVVQAGGAIALSPEPKPIAPPAYSEDHIALELATSMLDRYRWSPGLGWMAHTRTHWQRDDEMTRVTEARAVCRVAAQCVTQYSQQTKLTSNRAITSVLALAQSDQRLVIPVALWDAEPMLLNTPRGVVDLATGQMRPRQQDFVTQCTEVSPDASVPTPAFHGFLQDVFGGDRTLIDFMQRLLGYVLTGDRREQVLFFFQGSGANGKSTLVDLVQWLFGTYAAKLPSTALMSTRNEQHPTAVASLRGKRLALSSELDEGQYFNEPLVKELTGDSATTARFMRGDFFEFRLTQKHILVGNHKPRLRGGDPAMVRRIVLLPFAQVFDKARQDKGLLDKLKAEAGGIMAWLVDGAKAWHRHGLAIPESVRGASSEYMAEHDDVQMWLDERCLIGGDTKAGMLYSDYRFWKQQRGEAATTQTTFGDRLKTKPHVTKRVSNGVKYGLTLRPIAG